MGSVVIPMVLSKWGRAGEYIHQPRHCPYSHAKHIRFYREAQYGSWPVRDNRVRQARRRVPSDQWHWFSVPMDLTLASGWSTRGPCGIASTQCWSPDLSHIDAVWGTCRTRLSQWIRTRNLLLCLYPCSVPRWKGTTSLEPTRRKCKSITWLASSATKQAPGGRFHH